MSLGDILSGGLSGFAAGGPIGAAIGAGLGVMGSSKQRKAEKDAAQRAAAMADPFAQHRGAFADQLLSLYGIQKPFQYDTGKLSRIAELEGAQKAAESYDPTKAPTPPAHLRGIQKAAWLKNQSASAPQALTPEQQAELVKLKAEHTQAQTDWQANQKTPEQALLSIPGLQTALQQGTKQASRAAAAGGGRLSGNLLAELQQLGTGTVASYYNQEADRLAGLAGATGTAGGGAQYAAGVPATKPYEGAGGLLATLPGLLSAGKGLFSKPSGGDEAKWWSDASAYI